MIQSVSRPAGIGSRLLKQFGSFKDDPTFDDWLEEIAAYHHERNPIPELPTNDAFGSHFNRVIELPLQD